MREFDSYLEKIRPLRRSCFQLAQKRLEAQIRPAASLGFLEEVIKKIVAIQENLNPSVDPKCVFVFAGDHGVTEEGVSLYPAEVTAQMVYGFLSGRATINVFARSVGASVKVIDIGVDHDFPMNDDLLIRKVDYGTQNIACGPAMTQEQVLQALKVGIEVARGAKREGIKLAATGDMGIGNTTASSAMIAALCGKEVHEVTGRGTGIDDSTWRHKVQVIEKALAVNRDLLDDPIQALQALGGFEIAGIAGLVLGCAMEKIPVVVDGLVSSAGALVALELHPSVLDYVIFGHRSFERGQDAVLEKFNARPILDLDMRLGEGTGACLALGILEAGIKAFNEVATFEEAHVATKKIRQDAMVMRGAIP